MCSNTFPTNLQLQTSAGTEHIRNCSMTHANIDLEFSYQNASPIKGNWYQIFTLLHANLIANCKHEIAIGDETGKVQVQFTELCHAFLFSADY